MIAGIAKVVGKGAASIWRGGGGSLRTAAKIRRGIRGAGDAVGRIPGQTIPTASRVGRAVRGRFGDAEGASRSWGSRALKGADILQEQITNMPAAQLVGSKAGLAMGATFGTGSVLGIREMLQDPYAPLGPTSEREVLQQHQEQMRYSYGSRMLDLMRRRKAIESLMRLAKADPHLYNEVLAGETLAPGEMVFGGEPRLDLMETLAYDMADGAYKQEPDPEAEFMRLLQGSY